MMETSSSLTPQSNNMGQEEVLELLKKQSKPMSRGQIAKELGERDVKISLTIKKLLRYDEIKCIEINAAQAMKHYNCRRRLRIYYV